MVLSRQPLNLVLWRSRSLIGRLVFAFLMPFALIASPVIGSDDSKQESVDPDMVMPCDPSENEECVSVVELDQGHLFEGKVVDGEPSGEGLLRYNNGDRFEGFFDDGLRIGRGTYHLSGGGSYQGFWVRDRLNGPVRYQDASGNEYEGPILAHKPHGDGVMTYVNGDQYTGSFEAGEPHGRGIMVYGPSRGENHEDRYEGEFINGKRHGEAQYVWADGATWQVSCVEDRCKRSGVAGFIQDKGKKAENWISTPSKHSR